MAKTQQIEPLDPIAYFSDASWTGPYLELSIELGPADEERLMTAVSACWQSPRLRRLDISPRLRWSDSSPPLRWFDKLLRRGHLRDLVDELRWKPTTRVWSSYGELVVEAGPIGCQIGVVREAVSDWLYLSLPVGMLHRRFPVSYPLEPGRNPWITPLEKTLVEIADGIATQVPFDLALVGEDVATGLYGASSPVNELRTELIDRMGGALLSERLWERLQPADEPVLTQNGLRWIPIRQFDG